MANVLNLHVRVHINRKRKIVYKMSLHVLINVSPKNVNRDDVKIVVQVNLFVFVFIFDSGARSDLTQTQTAQQSTENGCVLESSSSSHSTSHVCVQLLCINLETA